ncbi:tRNA 2-thiouridine(34) synthase MnmA [Granulicella tundricola]|uniref:tRNA-specific 2-thiouridylase MnmA n=1 Tax=Granulicella tundricola (strain ATCC BAA-1859 / DSM 23138 / MP5ACTX9) TaxID=1198114 RepID=E8X2B2_GRATM|nr:tRNA 2-thiouridine(34) synthase MnmA [Granulicella tundricola]ADW68044.1 tRNA (5-methylaminomethyl-2-thiouridylate)-methyltransferase [Granulicella tundricola MP5ACTX9]
MSDLSQIPETIAVAMSGGVDSSAVAALLHEQGYDLIGLTLQLWNQRRLAGHEGMPESVQGRCCSIDDVYDARRVAEKIGIPYYLVNQQERFEADVVKPFVSEYLAGRTPIPCTLCNNHLKFDQLLLTARQVGATKIATGHYARNRFDEATGRWILSRPADRSKDQTYFLFGLTQDQLAHTLFPLGEMQKPAVRVMATEAGLDVAAKPDSQEICFIPGGDYQTFLRAYLDEQGEELPDSSGELVTSSGEVVGRHTGIHNFTVGQRKGLGLTSANPLYVLAIHPDSHQVQVGSDAELMTRELRANRLNWISIPEITEPIRVLAKVRHRHEPQPATLSSGGIGPDGDPIAIAIFDEPQRAITPGQAAIFYREDDVVGGGWII